MAYSTEEKRDVKRDESGTIKEMSMMMKKIAQKKWDNAKKIWNYYHFVRFLFSFPILFLFAFPI